ncbi:MAG: hypothetical protein CMN78_01575 [Spirochaetales bacterium]|nr:hypothetical protein [Spirochaetales bacterium]
MLTRDPDLFDLIGNRELDENPGFIDPDNGDFRTAAESGPIEMMGFRSIPIEEIGLYTGKFRSGDT